jgi:hypothetical protein
MAVIGEWVRNPGRASRGVIQRCSCGRAAHAGKSCEGCARKKRRLSRAGKGSVTLDDTTKNRVLAILKERGEPLDRRVRGVMEHALGASFGDVRVHRDGEAAQTASLLSASAYTVGRHIVFAQGQYAPATITGLRLLAHELTHVVQQHGQAESGIENLVVGPEDDALERAARDVAASIGAGQPVAAGGGSVDAASAQAVVQREQRVCGPNVSKQIQGVWSQIQTNFRSKWNDDQKKEACRYLIAPYPNLPFDLTKNIDAFDTLPLYYDGALAWLLKPEMLDFPCGVPAPDVAKQFSQKQAEDRGLCSSSVVAYGKCWLSGTVNYGTYGIMMSLCNAQFPTSNPWPFSELGIPPHGFSMAFGENLIRAYKKHGGTMAEYDINEPISWYKATFTGGPAARPLVAGNRSSCDASGKDCSVDGSIVDWDYVWEPVRPRKGAGHAKGVVFNPSTLPAKKAPAPGPAAQNLDWAIGWWKVSDGNVYYYYFYGDSDVIYIKQPPNKTWIPPKNTGRKGRVTPLPHGMKVTWPPFSDEDATEETFTRMEWTSTTDMFATSTKYSPLGAKKL